MANTKKYCVVRCTGGLVIDEVPAPWRPRGIVVQGRAEAVNGEERTLIRIHPERIASWGLFDVTGTAPGP